MVILFNQSDHTYCRIPARDFKYQGRQGFQGNEKFIKRIDIKQANISETNTGFRTSECGSVWIQVVPPDPKVHKLATRFTCMDGGCISNKLDTLKSIRLPTFCSYRESVSQSNEGQVYVDHNNTSVTVFIPPFPNLFTDPNQNQHPSCQNQILALAAWKISDNTILQKAYQTKQLTCLKVAKERAHCIITKWSSKSGVAGVFQEKLIPFLQM